MEQIKSKLKNVSLLLTIVVTTILLSCGSGTSKQSANKDGFTAIEEELKSKFGADAYYTDLSITYNKSIGNIIGVTVTEEPESLKMGQWNLTQDSWTQNQDIAIEVPSGTKAADYMFQLGDAINLTKLGSLVEQSVQKLKDEKKLKNPTLSIASVKFPNNGDISKAEYIINLQPENGNSTFTFQYTLNGDLIKMDY